MPRSRMRRPGIADYLAATREPRFSVLVVVALLAVYELGMVLTGSRLRNAADAGLKSLLNLLSPFGETAFHVFLLLTFLAAGWSLARSRGSVLRFLLPFLAESAIWAAMLSPAIFLLQQPFLAAPEPGPAEDLLLDVGAGVYEEIVFRFLIIRAGFLLLHLDPWRRRDATSDREPSASILRLMGPVALVMLVSAGAFSAYHHWGTGAEAFEPEVFLYRALAGLLLGGLYLWRGLGVAVYTHAFYDILVHLAGG